MKEFLKEASWFLWIGGLFFAAVVCIGGIGGFVIDAVLEKAVGKHIWLAWSLIGISSAFFTATAAFMIITEVKERRFIDADDDAVCSIFGGFGAPVFALSALFMIVSMDHSATALYTSITASVLSVVLGTAALILVN
jgi:hypothetical protein